jgi:hypothetical protein
VTLVDAQVNFGCVLNDTTKTMLVRPCSLSLHMCSSHA